MSFLEALGIADATKTVELSAWRIPTRIELHDGYLVATDPPSEWKSVGPNRAGLLVGFARLADADDDQILDFARTWGLLELCGHNQPRTHTSRSTTQLGSAPTPVCGELLPAGGEPVEIWRTYASQAAAFLAIHSRLLHGNDTNEAMWEPLRPLFPRFLDLPDDTRPEGLRQVHDFAGRSGRIGNIRITIPPLNEARPAIAYAVRRWMTMGAVGVQFEWTASIGTLTFGGQSLFGALATLVAVTLSGAEGPILCSHCRLPYNPTRKPRGPRHFCQTCRDDGQPQKYAKRDHSARKARQREASG